MKKKRKLSELYRLVLKEFTTYEIYRTPYTGICYVFIILMHNNIITSDESKILKEHFKSQRPTKDLHPEFFNHRSYTTGIGYWWKKWYYDGAEFLETGSNEERVKFLEKMIEITS